MSSPNQATSDAETQHLDEAIIVELKDIMEEDFVILLETYLDDASEKVAELQSALTTENAVEIREIAHSLKGASCNIGALPLANLCEVVEHLAKNGNVVEVAPLLPGIVAEFAAVKAVLEPQVS